MKNIKIKGFAIILLSLTLTSCNIVIKNSGNNTTSQNTLNSSSSNNYYLSILNNSEDNVYVNKEYQLKLNTNIEIKDLTFISDNEFVATVDELGVIHGLNVGIVTIYVVYQKLSASITLKVSKEGAMFEIIDESPIYLHINGTHQLNFRSSNTSNFPSWSSSNSSVCTIDSNGLITALSIGNSIITGTLENIERTISVNVLKESNGSETFYISIDSNTLGITEEANLNATYSFQTNNTPEYFIEQSENVIKLIDHDSIIGLNPGNASIYAILDDMISNTLSITVNDTDPYTNVNTTTFYNNYTKAISYTDAKYRSNHYLMSGSIKEQDQDATISNNRPNENNKYIRNTIYKFEDSNNTYGIIDSNGNVVNYIYKNGAYTTLEEVAAYVMAFGDIPSNYTSRKSANPSNEPWGKYLRLNHSYFTCDTSNYPFEPLLPNAVKYSTNGDLYYYEIDIGTTGTDCDPSHTPTNYNTGKKITRGAARIVYARYKGNDGTTISNLNDRYVFYTNNHYNDFREYLNYENGWGEIFGNITGGGTISSKTDYNPTPYVESIQKSL